jgi:hypothetical protein
MAIFIGQSLAHAAAAAVFIEQEPPGRGRHAEHK